MFSRKILVGYVVASFLIFAFLFFIISVYGIDLGSLLTYLVYGVFKKACNTTPIEKKQEIFCERAAELLITTDLSVEQISEMLNFSSSSYFRKIFKKHTGKTPLQIRKNTKHQI